MISVLACCEKARSFFGHAKDKYAELACIVPKNQFYHYHDMWRFVNQRLTFLISLTLFLETGKLATINQVAEILGRKCRTGGVSISLLTFFETSIILFQRIFIL
jgi:Translin family